MATKVVKNSGDSKPPAAGKGRPKGAKNKLTKSAKEAFQYAFEKVGGGEGLADWARENPTDFFKLYARLIPVEQQVTGKGGESLKVTVSFHTPNGH